LRPTGYGLLLRATRRRSAKGDMREVSTMRISIPVIVAGVLAVGIGGANAQTPVVVKKDPALDALISPDAKLEKIAGGFGFTEGALWVPKGEGGYLLFADMPANVIYQRTPDGEVSIFMEKCGYQQPDIWRVGFIQTNGKKREDAAFEEFPMIGCNGLTLDRQGRLVIATWAGRSIDRIEHNGKRIMLADRWDGKRFGGTNDVIVKKDGTIYFTDGYGGLRLRDKDPKRELDNGVYMIRNGQVARVIDDIPNTNGVAFSPDEKILYANGSRDRFIKAYDVNTDGTLCITDGLRVDVNGNLWETGPGGIWVISPQGKHLGTILLPELGANVEFGDADRKTLYIAARTSIYKIRTNIAGIP
jgi:gluconolactonase